MGILNKEKNDFDYENQIVFNRYKKVSMYLEDELIVSKSYINKEDNYIYTETESIQLDKDCGDPYGCDCNIYSKTVKHCHIDKANNKVLKKEVYEALQRYLQTKIVTTTIDVF